MTKCPNYDGFSKNIYTTVLSGYIHVHDVMSIEHVLRIGFWLFKPMRRHKEKLNKYNFGINIEPVCLVLFKSPLGAIINFIK